ncbi:MAG: diaminopimelate decarboxylase [Planctomycetota bacterium]
MTEPSTCDRGAPRDLPPAPGSRASRTDAWSTGAPGERPDFDRALLGRLAREHGTPLYVYDLDHAAARLARLTQPRRGVAAGGHAAAAGALEPERAGFDAVRYAQKANTNLALLRRLAREGARIDAVSAGELLRAIAAGFAPRDIQVTADALDRDLAALVGARGDTGELTYDVDLSVGSLDALRHIAALGRTRTALRINPGFGAGHHAKVTTGGPGTKHGIWHADAQVAVELARALGVTLTGLHLHVGSGATQERLEEMIAFTSEMLALMGPSVARVSIGGGLPVPYRPEDAPFNPAPFLARWRAAKLDWERARSGAPLELEVEPGRYLVAHAGVLVTEVLGSNRTPAFTFLMVDAGFHSVIRPAMYGAYHHVSPLICNEGAGTPMTPQVVAGPLCETSDLLTQTKMGEPDARLMPALQRGDLLLVHDVGAYGATMASGYNARPLPAEVVIEGGVATLARPREDLAAKIAEEALRLT